MSFLPMLSRSLLCSMLAGLLLAGQAEAAPPPLLNAGLRDTPWSLQTLDGLLQAPHGKLPAAQLTFSARSQHLSGFTGCNRLQGRFTQSGTQLVLAAAATTRKACGAEQIQRESHLLQVLKATDAYRIEGKVLSLMQGEVVRATFGAGKR